jgi:threonine dehydratase
MNRLPFNRKSSDVTIRDVWLARKQISHLVNKTPLVKSFYLSEMLQASVYLKLENLHQIGAFKVRGAANKILSLHSEEKQRGVTTFSTGNHGQAVAYIAKQIGIRAVVCISKRVPQAKVQAIKKWGAEIKIVGDSQDEAQEFCYLLQEKEGLAVIPPFDDPYIIAGQGTIGLEIIEDLPEVDVVIGGLSGGGLHAGVGLALKSMDPSIRVIGVSMEQGAVMHESLKAGKPIILGEKDSLADSLLGGIGLENKYTYRMVKEYVDESILISEDAIAEGMAYMLQHHGMVIEGAAAVGIGALLRKKIETTLDKNIVIIVSGCNVDLAAHLKATIPYVGNLRL